MATEHNRDLLGPLAEGEFQRIPGIGPGIAQRLHAAGVQTFSRLAALSPQEINTLLNGLVGMTAERIAAQDWPGKARELAGQLPQAEHLPQLVQETAAAHLSLEPEEPGDHQHYASFLVELLQDENQCVRRTRVAHVQNNAKTSLTGWDPQGLVRWITTQAAISMPAPAEPEAPADRAEPAQQVAEPIPAPAPLPAAELPEVETPPPASAPAAEASPAAVIAPAAPSSQAARPNLLAIELNPDGIFSSGGEAPQQFLNIGQPFEVRLSFEIHNGPGQAPLTAQTQPAPLMFRAAIETRLPGGQRLRIAEAHGPCATEGPTRLAIPAAGLEEGVYRFRITLLVYPEGAAQPERVGRFGISESGPVYVFSRESVLAM